MKPNPDVRSRFLWRWRRPVAGAVLFLLMAAPGASATPVAALKVQAAAEGETRTGLEEALTRGLELARTTLFPTVPSGLEERRGERMAEGQVNGVTIRWAREGELNDLLAFRGRVFVPSVMGYNPEFEIEVFRHRLSSILRGLDPGAVIIAHDGRQIIGYAVSRPDTIPDIGELAELAVDEAWRNRGVGQALVAHALDGLVQWPRIRRVLAMVASSTPGPVRRLLENAGFQGGELDYRLDLPAELLTTSGLPVALEQSFFPGDYRLVSGPTIPLRVWTGDRYQLRFGGGIPLPEPAVMTVAEMAEVLAPEGEGGLGVWSSRPLYWMYRGGHRPEDARRIEDHRLRYDITILPPSDRYARLGREPVVKTFGHYHSPRDLPPLPEVYEVLLGEAWFLLQKPSAVDPAVIEEVLLVKAKAGEKAIMPPGYGHIAINPSETRPLVLADWVSSAFEFDDQLYRQFRGGAYYVVGTPGTGYTLEVNRAYTQVPPVRVMRPAEELPEFGLSAGQPMYPLIQTAPERLAFLNAPEPFRGVFMRAFVPAGLGEGVVYEQAARRFEAAQQEFVKIARAQKAEVFDGMGVSILGEAALTQHPELWHVLGHLNHNLAMNVVVYVSPAFAATHARELDDLREMHNLGSFTAPRALVASTAFLQAQDAVYYTAGDDEAVRALQNAAGERAAIRAVPYQNLLQFFQQLIVFVRANMRANTPVERLSAEDLALARQFADLAENL